MPIEETENFVRIRQKSPGNFDKNSMRTITISEGKGIKAVIGCPKGSFQRGRCSVGTEVQTYLFEKPKWGMEKARAWVREHKKEEAIPFDLPPGHEKPLKKEFDAFSEEVKAAMAKMDSGVWYKRPGQRVQPEEKEEEEES